MNSAYETLRCRPQPLAVKSFTDVKKTGVFEGFVVSVGPRDQELKTARVYIPHFSQIMNCLNLSSSYSSDKGIGIQYGLFAGDRVSVEFLQGNSSAPAITGYFPHTANLATGVNSSATQKVKTPLSSVPTAAEWGFVTEYVQVLGAVLL